MIDDPNDFEDEAEPLVPDHRGTEINDPNDFEDEAEPLVPDHRGTEIKIQINFAPLLDCDVSCVPLLRSTMKLLQRGRCG